MLPSLLLFLQCDSSILTTGSNLNFSKEDRKLTRHQQKVQEQYLRFLLTILLRNLLPYPLDLEQHLTLLTKSQKFKLKNTELSPKISCLSVLVVCLLNVSGTLSITFHLSPT